MAYSTQLSVDSDCISLSLVYNDTVLDTVHDEPYRVNKACVNKQIDIWKRQYNTDIIDLPTNINEV